MFIYLLCPTLVKSLNLKLNFDYIIKNQLSKFGKKWRKDA